MSDERIRAAVRAALETAGGPAGVSDVIDQATEISLRRWRSYDRRARQRRPTDADKIEDLAKGLRDAFEPDRNLVGPLMAEYRWSAQAVAAVLLQEAAQRTIRLPPQPLTTARAADDHPGAGGPRRRRWERMRFRYGR